MYSFESFWLQEKLESLDPRGRTPLHLAVTLGHLESARTLLRHGANANAENSRYWTGKLFIIDSMLLQNKHFLSSISLAKALTLMDIVCSGV